MKKYFPYIVLTFFFMILFKKVRSMLSGYTGIALNNPYSSDNSKRIFQQGMKRGLGSVVSRMLTAWSKWETGNYKSHFVKDDNAYFGYARDKNSKYQIGGGGIADNSHPIGSYGSLEDSVNEVVDWMNRRYSKQDRGKWPKPADIKNVEQLAMLLNQSKYGNYGASGTIAGLKKYFDSNY